MLLFVGLILIFIFSFFIILFIGEEDFRKNFFSIKTAILPAYDNLEKEFWIVQYKYGIRWTTEDTYCTFEDAMQAAQMLQDKDRTQRRIYKRNKSLKRIIVKPESYL